MDERIKNFNTVCDNVHTRDLLEQAAEEAAELTQALLKLIRAEKLSDNPTTVTLDQAVEQVTEELSDVMLCMRLLGFEADEYIMDAKLERWANRLEGKE